MKKLFILSFSLSALVITGFSQPQAPGSGSATMTTSLDGNGKISGVIKDAATGQPVEYATVALMDKSTDKPVNGTVCDDKGKFTITKIDDGQYTVVVSFIGYETKSIDVEIIKGKNIDLGTVTIGEEAKVLKEVVVEGQRALIEEKVDRTVYNAENDQTTRGGDATDVLKRVPMLSVDLDGNVSLRGNQNISVLINNKPSTILASNVADALKQIPAEQIKNVEVITSPSAKYDAEGSAGIINIITKKNTLEGVTLQINSSAGLRGSNLGLNGNFRRKNFGISLGGHGRAGYNVKGSFENSQDYKNNGTVFQRNTQQADTRNNNLWGNYNLGFDYDINKYNNLAASFRFGVRNGSNYQDDLFTQTFAAKDTSTLANLRTLDNSQNYNFNLTYTRTFEKPQKEFSILTMYSRNNRANDFNSTYYNFSDNSILQQLQNLNDSYNEEFTFQTDFQSPIKDNQLIEMGAKEIMRNVSSDYQYFKDGVSYRPNNLFSYSQNVTAGYLSYTLATRSSYSFKTGARYEYTIINANFKNPNPEEGNLSIPSYGILVPSINVSKKLKNGNTLKASYNRRIQRPSIQYLNPYLQVNNPLSQSQGNPQLDPEYTNNYELSYNTFIKGTSLNFSGFARNTNNGIQTIRQIKVIDSDTVLFTTYQNIGIENAYGVNLFAGINVGKLSLNGGGDFYYATLTNNDLNPEYAASNEGFVMSGRFFGNYNLNKGWGLQFFAFYRGRQVQLQGKQGGFGIYSLSVKKDFNERRGSIGFGAENFFTNGIKIKNEVHSYSVDQSSTNIMRNMNFKINFSYRIGKMSFDQQPRRRRSINNDDLKENGGNDMQIDQQMGNQGAGGNRGSGMQRPEQPQQQAATQTPVSTDSVAYEAAGTWNYTLDNPQQPGTGTIVLVKDGDTYSGTIKSNRMQQETKLTSVKVEGNNVTFTYSVNFGGNEVSITVNAVISKDELTGTMNFGQFRSMPMKATRFN